MPYELFRTSYSHNSSQSELRLPLLQVVSNNKSFSVGVQSPTEINAPMRMCSDSEKNMSAFADQNHAASLTCVRLEFIVTILLILERTSGQTENGFIR